MDKDKGLPTHSGGLLLYKEENETHCISTSQTVIEEIPISSKTQFRSEEVPTSFVLIPDPHLGIGITPGSLGIRPDDIPIGEGSDLIRSDSGSSLQSCRQTASRRRGDHQEMLSLLQKK
jgi:hypothetical protein